MWVLLLLLSKLFIFAAGFMVVVLLREVTCRMLLKYRRSDEMSIRALLFLVVVIRVHFYRNYVGPKGHSLKCQHG